MPSTSTATATVSTMSPSRSSTSVWWPRCPARRRICWSRSPPPRPAGCGRCCWRAASSRLSSSTGPGWAAARRWRGRPWWPSPRRRAWSVRAGPAWWTRSARSSWSGADDARPDHPVGPPQRPRGHRRGDGYGAGPQCLLLEHQGAPGLLGGALRRRGPMVAQAEQIPVHLGAMPESVAAVMARDPRPGDVWILNDPYTGGTHLPDITLVSPVAVGGAIVAYAVTRAHHSDIGGMSPGSMPAGSRDLWQEGLIIPPVRLTDDVLELICANSRTPRLRRGDFRAQVSANRVAQRRISELVDHRGLDTLLAGFEEVLRYAERRTREALRRLPDGTYRACTELEGDGVTDKDIVVDVTVTVAGDTAHIDFAGTAAAVEGNVNCPLAVTRSACYFALRVLLPEDVPANAGTYAPLTIAATEGSLVNAGPPHAVVAGNVETSQRIADAVLAALAAVTDVPLSLI